MADVLPPRALITLSKCGMPPPAEMYLSTRVIPLLSLRQPGRLMASALPLEAWTILCRCGMRDDDLVLAHLATFLFQLSWECATYEFCRLPHQLPCGW